MRSKMSMCLVLIGVLQPFVLLVTAQDLGLVAGSQCNTPNNEQGQCISIRSCPPLMQMLQQQGLAAGNYLRQSLCVNQNGNPIVCCPSSNLNPRGRKEVPETTTYDPLLPPNSGYNNASHTRIVGGIVSEPRSVVGPRCVTPNNERGQCISIRSCQPLMDMLRQQGLAASNYLKQSLCVNLNGNPIVCCPSGNLNPRGSKGVPETTAYGPLLPPNCGYSNASHTRIVGGIVSEPRTWPWIAALGYRDEENPLQPKWRCGGTLISARHVLTAAHCAIETGLYVARIGDVNLVRDDDGARPVEVTIEQKIIHPGYNRTTRVGDIAVLRLVQDVPFSDYVYPICLPVEEPLKSSNFLRKFPFVAGWGATSFPEEMSSEDLMEAQLPVVSNEYCQTVYSNVVNAIIDDRMICAGYPEGGADACSGDSGGPLMLPKKYFFYQIGVFTHGQTCGGAGSPGVYARVTAHLNFIFWAMQ